MIFMAARSDLTEFFKIRNFNIEIKIKFDHPDI